MPFRKYTPLLLFFSLAAFGILLAATRDATGAISNSLTLTDPNVRQNIWYYYWSSLAQAMASGASICLVIFFFRLQTISASLSNLEAVIHKLFSSLGLNAELTYYSKLVPLAWTDQWAGFFNELTCISKELSSANDPKTAALWLATLESIISRGEYLHSQYTRMHQFITISFLLTVLPVALSIAFIPFAGAVTSSTLLLIWLLSIAGMFIVISIQFKLLKHFYDGTGTSNPKT